MLRHRRLGSNLVNRLTVVLTAYRRLEHTLAIATQLREQTESIDLWLWDNSSVPAGWQGNVFDQVVRSSFNTGCAARWWLAVQAETPLVLVTDDDLIPTDEETLRDTCDWLESNPGRAAGLVGVKLRKEREYMQCPTFGHGKRRPKLEQDTEVDIIKGRYLAVERERLEKLPLRLPKFEDDIAVSSCLRGGVILAGLQGRFTDLPTGCEAVSSRKNHAAEREKARRKWFRG